MEFAGYVGGVICYSKVCFLRIKNHDRRHALRVFFDFKQQLILIKIILIKAGPTKLCITSSYISICSIGVAFRNSPDVIWYFKYSLISGRSVAGRIHFFGHQLHKERSYPL